jgi:ZIP family zinc transporter
MTWIYIFLPVLAAVVGGAVAAVKPPGPRMTSAIQHLAAGVVFAAAAGEILPAIKAEATALPIVIGGAIGIVAMLIVRTVGDRLSGPVALVAMIGVDVFIDGVVLGIGFASGAKAGIVLTIALTLEVLFLGLSVAASLNGRAAASRVFLITAAVSLLLPIGAAIGLPAQALPAPWLAGLFSFGLIALLYLVTEELLVEAHQQSEDTPLITSMFFVGFLALVVLEEAI